MPPQPSLAPHALPVQSGVQPHVPPAHASGALHVSPGQHAWPLPPHAPHVVPQVVPDAHSMQTVPPCPHAVLSVPDSHVVPLQHPLHDVASHAHTPFEHSCPVPHVPLVHTPPHPSLAPHALPVQLAVHPQTPLAPPPPHVSGALHAPPSQHAWPLPPHAPHVVPQVVPDAHAAHALPPMPHADSSEPDSHVVPLQQPEHDVGSHVQAPCTQCCPVSQVPAVHTPSHPLLAPHVAPVQLGVQVPAPHTLGVPPPPHASPTSHPPQSTSVPHRFAS